MECNTKDDIGSQISCILTYSNSTNDIVINYIILALNILSAIIIVRYKLQIIGNNRTRQKNVYLLSLTISLLFGMSIIIWPYRFLLCLTKLVNTCKLIVVLFQIILCLFVGCAGISIIWYVLCARIICVILCFIIFTCCRIHTGAQHMDGRIENFY